MKLSKLAAAGAMAALAGASLIGCSSSSGSGSGASLAGTTITYWATNQGASLQADKTVLTPELNKFTKETGIKVNLQVIPWATDDTKILAATVSGKGPDVLNFGNTDAWTFGATGALLPWTSSQLSQIGGSGKFIPNVLAAAGQAPYTSLPLYSQAYGLFYNKAMFSKAGLTPPTTWQELVSDAKKLTNASTQSYGMAIQGASVSENMHFAYIFARQNGGSPFNAQNQPTFTTTGNVNGLEQYINLMSSGVINPSDAQDSTGTLQMSQFAHGKAGMMMIQNDAIPALASLGMSTSQYGVVPIPAPSPLPAGGQDLASFVAGTNIAVFKNTPHLDAAIKFVNFMTSAAEQQALDQKYQLLPVLSGASQGFISDPAIAQAFTGILNTKAQPLPLKANVEAYQQTVGSQLVTLMGKAATGSAVSMSAIQAAMQSAQAQMPAT
jgi:multiple sugar transport system substrate-binding protein